MKIISVQSDKIPYQWNKVSYGTYKKIVADSSDTYKILSYFIDATPEEIKRAKVEGFEVVMERLKFLRETPVWDETPHSLLGMKMPKDITWETTEQYEMMRLLFATELTPLQTIEHYGEAVAMYYQPIVQKTDFDPEKATALLPQINEASCVEVVSLGRFFYAKLVSLQSGIPISYLTANTPQKKRRPGFRSLIKRLTSMRSSTFFRRATS